ncbi:phenylpyruvate tautomerase [Mariprofundus ferrinatatus]|uniref:L-dopachrome isomerase n=1 Tax=Mariprofundus ferrinatatus TaxID=1921087 RepID=A0A2K8L5F3_9PROT|nr:phenylpyruvate tautomerase MIF-related protein [Mariprofundus ferrinatatus]ATX82548.1 phenylpyruvate tautomerase [Mariprofundus ferrinatatus]
MPYLHIHTNVKIENHPDFLARCSHLAAVALEKPESYVMVELSDNCSMVFAGSDLPLVFVELKSIGISPADTSHVSNKFSKMIHKLLGVDMSRIYIEFESPERDMFGWKGGTF